MAWIREQRPPGPIFHHMNDGGFVLWQLGPDYEVMVDGRLEVYGAERLGRLTATDPASFADLDADTTSARRS